MSARTSGIKGLTGKTGSLGLTKLTRPTLGKGRWKKNVYFARARIPRGISVLAQLSKDYNLLLEGLGKDFPNVRHQASLELKKRSLAIL